MRLFIWAAAVTALQLAAAGCPGPHFRGNDLLQMRAAKSIALAIDDYYADTSNYPDALTDVKSYFGAEGGWPVNPYDGKPIADTGSPGFDPATSVGMVYYQKMYRDEMLINYQLHVFGAKGKLYIIGNTAAGLKE